MGAGPKGRIDLDVGKRRISEEHCACRDLCEQRNGCWRCGVNKLNVWPEREAHCKDEIVIFE